jgi:hypothetical protein
LEGQSCSCYQKKTTKTTMGNVFQKLLLAPEGTVTAIGTCAEKTINATGNASEKVILASGTSSAKVIKAVKLKSDMIDDE